MSEDNVSTGPKPNTLKNSKNHVFDSRYMSIHCLQKLLWVNEPISASIILPQKTL